MSALETQNWFVSIGEEVAGPLSWAELDARVRGGNAEETACVRSEASAAWRPYKFVAPPAMPHPGPPPKPAVAVGVPPPVVPSSAHPSAPPPPSAAPGGDEDAVGFCQTAIRLRLMTPELAHEVLEQRRVDAAIGYQKTLFAYLQERNILTVDQIALVLKEHAAEKAVAAAVVVKVPPKRKPLRFSMLFPVKSWLDERPWASPWVRWFAFFALFPLVLGELVTSSTSLRDVVVLLGIYFATLSCITLYFWLKPETIPWGRVVAIAAFTGTIGIALVLYGQNLPLISELYGVTKSPDFLTRTLGSVFGIGVVEEGAKLLPLYWLFVNRKKPADWRQIVFLGAVSGLAFGISEAIQYSYTYAGAHAQEMLSEVLQSRQISEALYAQYILAEETRLIALPLLHGLFTALSGVFVAFAARVPSQAVGLVLRGWFAAAVLHGLFDAAQYPKNPLPWLAISVGLAALLLFVLYSHTAASIAEKISTEQQT